jgi:hypothetical protein
MQDEPQLLPFAVFHAPPPDVNTLRNAVGGPIATGERNVSKAMS